MSNTIEENLRAIGYVFCGLSEDEANAAYITDASHALEKIYDQLDELEEIVSITLRYTAHQRALQEERDDYREALEKIGATLNIGTDGSRAFHYKIKNDKQI